MSKYTLTCNCYEVMAREDVTVAANDIDEAWNKAKMKFARKYKCKKSDVSITSCQKIN